MMFVRTPIQFYVMRFALGAAEAGFFPGVVYYLMHWFPAEERGRAISRFYVALPLSGVVMGMLAGLLLGLRGFGLAGWQWLFLVEGAPAIALSVAIWFLLPDRPADAPWLTAAEKDWIARRLAADRDAVGAGGDPGVVRALSDWRIWLLGAANVLILGSAYAYNLSAPTILAGATRLDPTRVGFVVAAASAVAAVGMVTAGWHSDHRRERHWHTIGLLVAMAAAFLAAGLYPQPWIVVGAYAIYTICGAALQTVFWLIPSDALHGRSAAVGVAAIGSIGMLGAFAGPWAWGVARDRTGGFQAGELTLFAAYAVAALLIVAMRRLQRARAREAVALAA
jgi:ACS family tartrate transporter-like MFS transporter